jgi:putative ABC transport system permease protein
MFQNYIKIAFRNLLRHKAFSFINIAGLAIGMACSILILLWVEHETSFDTFHKDFSKIYRITAQLKELEVKAAVTSAPIANAIQQQIPQIQSAVRIAPGRTGLLQVEDRVFEEKAIMFVDSNFFSFFSFPLISGDPATVLRQPESIVISEAMAKKYFGNTDPIGKTIRQNHKDDFTVSGIMADVPQNSHLQFDFVQPMSFLARTERDLKENIWDNFNFFTYITIDQKSTPETIRTIDTRIEEIYKANEPNLKVEFRLQKLGDIHLRSKFIADVPGNGNIQYVYTFIVVAIFILVVACINFMNLATARSARRAKEVGLRKVAGAARFQLIRQFLAESSVISFLSLVLAVILVIVALPYFNDLAGKKLGVDFLNIGHVGWAIGITLMTGILAGSYPALFLSGFVPVKVLKGNLKTGAGGSLFRNTMVIIQFAVSITLLVGTAVIFDQMQFMRNRDLGFDKENLIYVQMTGDTWSKYQTLRSSLDENPLTTNFTFVQDLPVALSNATIGVQWEGKDPNSQPLFCTMAIDEHFVDIFNLQLLHGRSFAEEFKADTANYIVNEKALKTMNMDAATAVGSKLTMWGTTGTIIGVVKDFNFKPLQTPIEPLIIRRNTWGGVAVIKTKPNETEATIQAAESIFKTLNPAYPFTYNFVDEDLNKLYKSEAQLSNLFTVFAGLAIFISCLGLYGLSAFLAERRTKEIGVRKVLGASVAHVVFLLSRAFTVPVAVAMVIATPLSWYLMSRWLEGFAFHVNLGWSVFLGAFVVALMIALLTVCYESLKAAIANPAKSLRDE